jgi:hypothetical protein
MSIDKEKIFMRDKKVDSASGVDVRDTTQLKGDAKDSFQGSNALVQYDTTMPKIGTLGGKSEDHG